MQVAPGVFQFKVPMPSNRLIPGGGIRYTLVYLVSAPLDRWVIIDAGMNSDEGFRALKEQLIQSGITPSDVVVNLITHIHPDHSGLANRLKELTGAPIACTSWIHRAEVNPQGGGTVQIKQFVASS